jgi:hypothetical protein
MSKPYNPAQQVENLTMQAGGGALPESTQVTPMADVAGSLNNLYFTLHDGLNALFYVWLNVNGAGVDPAPGGTGIAVAVATGASAATIAAAIAAAVLATAGFYAVVNPAGVVQISNTVGGASTDVAAGTSGFTITKLQKGHADDYSPATKVDSISDNPAAF